MSVRAAAYSIRLRNTNALGNDKALESDVPPYKPVVSRSQSRKLFALANRGEISKAEARGKTRAADFKTLPEHVRGNRYHPSRHGK